MQKTMRNSTFLGFFAAAAAAATVAGCHGQPTASTPEGTLQTEQTATTADAAQTKKVSTWQKIKGYNPYQRVRNSPSAPLNDTPLVVDGAMQIRDWDRSIALYQNGDTIAGPTGFPLEPRYTQSEWVYPAAETPLFLAQTALLPFTLSVTPPWTQWRYQGETVEPSYTANPPLPANPVIFEPTYSQPPATVTDIPVTDAVGAPLTSPEPMPTPAPITATSPTTQP